MKLWIGHYLGNEEQWFVAWGETKMDAATLVDELWGEPDLRSMKPVEAPGAFNFRPEPARDEDGEPFIGYANADDLEEPVEMSLGAEAGYDEDEAWIVERVTRPLPEPRGRRAGEEHGVWQEALVLARAGMLEAQVAPPCDCDLDADLINGPCHQHEPGEAVPGRCVVCEHLARCHPPAGVRP